MDLKRGERDWYLSAPFLWWFQSVTSCDQGVKEFRSQWVGGERHFLNLVWPAPSCYLMATKWKIGRFQPAFFRRVSLFFVVALLGPPSWKATGGMGTFPPDRMVGRRKMATKSINLVLAEPFIIINIMRWTWWWSISCANPIKVHRGCCRLLKLKRPVIKYAPQSCC